MSRKVVHDDDITAVERWSQTLFDVCEEDRPAHCPINHEGCDHPVVAQSDNQGDGLPMAVGNGPDQSFAPRATAPESHQAGAGGGLVDEHQSGGIKQALLANPAPPRQRHVRPFLLRRAQAFFDGDIISLEKSPDRGATAWNSLLAHGRNDLVQGQIRLLGYQRRRAPAAQLCSGASDVTPALQPPHRRTGAQAEASRRDAPATTASIARSRKSSE